MHWLARHGLDRPLKRQPGVAEVPEPGARVESHRDLSAFGEARYPRRVGEDHPRGDRVHSRIVAELRHLDVLRERSVEIEPAAIDEPQETVCEDGLTEGRCLEHGLRPDGSAVHRVPNTEFPGPDLRPPSTTAIEIPGIPALSRSAGMRAARGPIAGLMLEVCPCAAAGVDRKTTQRQGRRFETRIGPPTRREG